MPASASPSPAATGALADATDAALLAAYARCGDGAAFGEFTRRHLDLVYSAALRQTGGRHHDAQEVAQQVFLIVARRAAALARHPRLLAWLHLAVRHAARNHRRAARRRVALAARAMPELSDVSSPFPSAEPAPDWPAVARVLDDALADHGEAYRQAVLLRYFAQQPFAEVGRRLGLADNAARMRVERALEKLRRALARRGVTSTAAALGLVLGQHAVTAAPPGAAALVVGTAGAAAVALSAGGAFTFTTLTLATMSSAKWIAAGAAALAAAGLATWALWPAPPPSAVATPVASTALVAADATPPPAAATLPTAPSLEAERIRTLERQLAEKETELNRLRYQTTLQASIIAANNEELRARAEDPRRAATSVFTDLREAGAFAAALNERARAFMRDFPKAPADGTPPDVHYKKRLDEMTRDAALLTNDPLFMGEMLSGEGPRVAAAQAAYVGASLSFDPARQEELQKTIAEAYRRATEEKLDSPMMPSKHGGTAADDAAWQAGRDRLNAQLVAEIKRRLSPEERQRYEALGFDQLLFTLNIGGKL